MGPASRSASGYIDHIDGLRCLAVLLVLFFHAGLAGFSGGYIGVDIFFVISGFLMTRIVLAMPPGRDALWRFYASRFRRIVPAYIVAVAVVSIVATLVFLPIQLKMVVPSIVSCLVFLSNVVFYKTTSYFSPDLSYNPLLHTWSLAVEWQFYLVYPFVFLFFRKLGFGRVTALASLGVISLAMCATIMHFGKVSAAFYLLPTRMWEFALGGAASLLVGTALPRRAVQMLMFSAVLAIALCTLFYDHDTMFPGFAAVAPCVATALLLLEGGRPGLVRAFLVAPPVRVIGQASYSIYLWHWPVIVFLDYGFVPQLGVGNAWHLPVTLLLSFGLGLLSWRYVEAPFRRPAAQRGPGNYAWLSGCAGVAALVAIVIVTTGGLPQRFDASVTTMADAYSDVGKYRDCLARTEAAGDRFDTLCRIGETKTRTSFLLMGDSHAAALAEGISQDAELVKKGGILYATDACAPLLDFPTGAVAYRRKCEIAQREIPALVAQKKPDAVILHAAWFEYYRGHADTFKTALENTLDWFAARKIRVYLVDDTPGATGNVPIGLAKQIAFQLPFDLISTDRYSAEHLAVGQLMKQEAAARGFEYLNVTADLCGKGGYCAVAQDGRPLYWDNSHLSGFGSRLIGSDLARDFHMMF
jgi:peptidoglycan/LPS O-acetylase OafA/YrhL